MSVSWFICSWLPMWLFWRWIQSICSVDNSFLVILSLGGIVGSSYMMVSAAKWAHRPHHNLHDMLCVGVLHQGHVQYKVFLDFLDCLIVP
jgi:hypothetical protein